MGRCRNCGSWTKYPHNNGWCFTCFFFNYKEPRFWVSILLTLFILYLPIIDGEGLRSIMMGLLFKETGFILFILAKFVIDLLALVGTFLGVSKVLYINFKI